MIGPDERVFALGDCASFIPEGASRPVPPFALHDLGSLVSLSRYNAFGTLGRHGLFRNRFIRGRFAQLSHAMLYRLHQAELHGFGRASLIWLSDAIASAVRPRIRVD